ncbi:MAG: mechanosensitive ion channel family protein [Acidimicrobiia bacterium]
MLLAESSMGKIGDALERFARDEGLRLILTLLGTVVAIRLVRIILYRVKAHLETSALAARGGVSDPGRLQALFDILNYLAVAVVVGVGVMAALSVVGVNTGALLASAGVLGFAVGFGAQTMVKDLLNGLFLLAEGQYTIGDNIEVNGVTGIVERVTLRTTTLRNPNGDVHIVPSGDVRLVTNKSKGWTRVQIDVGVGYATPVERAVEVLEGYCAELPADTELADLLIDAPSVLGVEAFMETQYTVRVVAKVPSGMARTAERRMRRLLRVAFEQAGIEPPPPSSSSAPVPSSGK